MKRLTLTFSTALSAALVACSSSSPPVIGATPTDDAGIDSPVDAGSTSPKVKPGTGIGDVTLGMKYADVRRLLGGEASVIGFNRAVFGKYPGQKLELVFASADADTLSDDAIVLAVSALAGGTFEGTPHPGQARKDIEGSLGAPGDVIGNIGYWPSGTSVVFDGAGDDALAGNVAVFAPYAKDVAAPPPMKAASGKGGPRPASDPKTFGMIDMHLHPGHFDRIPHASRNFLVSLTPPATQAYAPPSLTAATDAYFPFIGIQSQTELAGLAHAVLFAVYTEKTTGWFGNDELEAVLLDPRNTAKDGLPWAFGFASIDFEGWLKADGTVDDAVRTARLAALSSYFESRPDLFLGIKLAHAHQGIALDDPRYLDVYGVAAKYDVPIYLHTGFTPFPGAENTRASYDPEGLRSVAKNEPKVRLVVGHVGQGDAAAVEHALQLAQDFPNVWLEISALKSPLQLDADGHASTSKDPQYLHVLEQIKARGLAGKTLFGSDGPQYSGMVKSYSSAIVEAMMAKSFTDAEIAAVMGGNFARLYLPAK